MWSYKQSVVFCATINSLFFHSKVYPEMTHLLCSSISNGLTLNFIVLAVVQPIGVCLYSL